MRMSTAPAARTRPELRALDIEDQGLVGRVLQREPEGDLLSVACVLGGRPSAMAELQYLRWAGDEEIGRCALDAS